ncbi:ABC transporter permease [Streptomyces sp. NPDC059740]|uniref:ABC transporter permease n=1 Tax=Streptomyces sp. NPDC059740 TaxID=3346926 RepID=UPI00365B1760
MRSGLYHPTVARLTFRALLGRRRALVLLALPVLLLLISVAVRLLTGADDATANTVLGGFALGTMVPLVGVVVGSGAIGSEIDDGSVVYLLAKPVSRATILLTKLLVAVGVSAALCVVPVLLSGLVLAGGGQGIAVAYALATLVACVAYGAVFLLLGVVTRHAVVFGLVYALVWEAFVGNLVPGARTLSVQQWALAVGGRAAADSAVTSDVGLPLAVVLLVAVTVLATWYAVRRLRTHTVSGEE